MDLVVYPDSLPLFLAGFFALVSWFGVVYPVSFWLTSLHLKQGSVLVNVSSFLDFQQVTGIPY